MRTSNEYQTTRIWTKTLRLLRMIHAITGESIVEIIERLSLREMTRLQERGMMMSEKTQQAMQQLTEIDEIILQDSKEVHPGAYDRFMSLVHQKEGLIEVIQAETGRTPRWTSDGYKLVE